MSLNNQKGDDDIKNNNNNHQLNKEEDDNDNQNHKEAPSNHDHDNQNHNNDSSSSSLIVDAHNDNDENNNNNNNNDDDDNCSSYPQYLLGCRYEEGWQASLNPSIQTTTVAAMKAHSKDNQRKNKQKRIIDVTCLCFLGLVFCKYVSSNCRVEFYCAVNSTPSYIIVVTRQGLLCVRE